MLKTRIGSAVGLGVAAVVLTATTALGAPTGDQILQKALVLGSNVQDYTAQVSMTSNIMGSPAEVPSYKVYFERPDKIHIESKSLVVVPRKVFSFGDVGEKVREGATVLLIGQKVVNGITMYTVKLVPKEDPEAHPERVLVTINSSRWTIEMIEIVAADKAHMVMSFTYSLEAGKYWMPSMIKASIPEAPKRDGGLGGEVSLSFTDYTVNTGLDDSLFEEE